MIITVAKSRRELTAKTLDGTVIMKCPVALGSSPTGHKYASGDGRTPEGHYFVCLMRENGKFGPSLGISYPGLQDAENAVNEGRLEAGLLPLFAAAEENKTRPPWGTALGGEICIHGGGDTHDWTAGCISLSDENIRKLFALCHEGDTVIISP